MATSSIRILVVDDFEPFRQFVCLTLRNNLELPTIYEASDGVAAIGLARALQPDLIVIDIGLPLLDGIEAVRRIRDLAPQSKILFVSQLSSADLVQAAFSVGASGYVVKMDAGRELATAVRALLRGERFVGSRFAGRGFIAASDAPAPGRLQGNNIFVPPRQQDMESDYRHEVRFNSDDESFLRGFTQFIGNALNAGSPVIVLATESHRNDLLLRLRAQGLDIGAAIEQGRYISLNAAEAVSTIMVKDVLDPAKFWKATNDLIAEAANSVEFQHTRIAACGECAPILWAQGKAEAAIQLEHLWNEAAKLHGLDVLCAYPLESFRGGTDSQIFQRICAEHSAVGSQ